MPSKKILVVEDEADLRKLIAEQLKMAGYEVFQAVDGEEGFMKAREVCPDLILSDVIMPKKDGNQFYKELKKTDFGKDIPFVILTARANMRDYFEILQVDSFMEKPFTMHDLLERIELTLSRRAGSGTGEEAPPERSRRSVLDATSEAIVDDQIVNVRAADIEIESSPGAIIKKAAVAKEKKEKKSGDRKSILILENDPLVFRELQSLFSKCGFEADVVVTVSDCREELERYTPDVLIMKHSFGEINAEDLAESLKQTPRLKDVPIIIYKVIGRTGERVNESGQKELGFIINDEGYAMFKRALQLLKSG
ncbi:MAG TPA: response regulator [Candidatus Omnitrophota bacterium]|nr:response regulator [Candidatus Omnitrophota bacterium]HPB68206.1 response regulator [Candidatus Omnitrophota bacterium]HQO58180.1 response regulator [Candidatus Omnitrophota bacterium]HQP12689.1 response regulator [Candidatus Omnitrophota bacterium]